ncbi:transposase [candidate division KSB1 bacterium]|nr:transposase [candidate division KSB1 bacterium]
MNDTSQPKRYNGTVRLPYLHYSEAGGYAITVVSHDRTPLFGRIEDGQMIASEYGLVVLREWMKSPVLRPGLMLDVFCLMPNHLHGIVILMESEQIAHGTEQIAHGCAALPRGPRDRAKRSISSMIAGFKAATTKRINELRGTPGQPVWQPKFYEHVIRNGADLLRQQEYITNNPLQWELDDEHPHP